MSTVHAPYGFVPLNDKVFLPEWAPQANQDSPFRDGVCGTLEIEVQAHTDIFVRGGGDPGQEQTFFKGPNGYAIPGSSLRGLLRNTVEIASFGWMKRVNNHRYGVRDLTSSKNFYLSQMTRLEPQPSGKPVPVPLVLAGWLRRNDRGGLDESPTQRPVAWITPCSFAKFEYERLTRFADSVGVRNFWPGRRQSAVDKYRAWGVARADDQKLAIQVAVRALRDRERGTPPVDYGLVTGPGTVPGTVVMTGQPAPWNPGEVDKKHHDFVFYGRLNGCDVPVPPDVMEGFEFVHGDGQQRHSLNQRRERNDEWAFWGKEYDAGRDVPVFFLLEQDGRTLRAFGLAMMFRLAYRHTTRDAVRHAQPTLDSALEPDLAELLFGHVSSRSGAAERREESRKGRVSIGMAAAIGAPQAGAAVTAVLGAPKASFYPSYVEQDPRRPGAPPPGGKDTYTTYMDRGVRIRGHKRYRPQPTVVSGPPLPTNAQGKVNTKVGTTFRPLPAQTRFLAKVHVHNLRLVELGALLWAIDFGGRKDDRFHTIGMARNLGYGRASLTVLRSALERNDRGDTAGILDAARAAFQEVMEAWCARNSIAGGWAGSARVAELLALAEVLPADSPHRQQMSIALIDPNRAGRKINEFVDAKKSGDVLPNVSRPASAVASTQSASSTFNRPFAGAGARPPTPAAPPAGGGGWLAIRGGTEIEAELVGINPKGKWQIKASLQGFDVSATVGQGTAPADATAGQRVTLIVTAGGDRRNLGLKWKG